MLVKDYHSLQKLLESRLKYSAVATASPECKFKTNGVRKKGRTQIASCTKKYGKQCIIRSNKERKKSPSISKGNSTKLSVKIEAYLSQELLIYAYAFFRTTVFRKANVMKFRLFWWHQLLPRIYALAIHTTICRKVIASIFQTFWKTDCCTIFLFIELETSNFGYSYIF